MVTKTGSLSRRRTGGRPLEFSKKAQSIVGRRRRPPSRAAAAPSYDMLGAAKTVPPEGGTGPREQPVCVEDYSKCDDRPGQPCLVIYTHKGQNLALPSESTALESMSSRLRADYSVETTEKTAAAGTRGWDPTRSSAPTS